MLCPICTIPLMPSGPTASTWMSTKTLHSESYCRQSSQIEMFENCPCVILYPSSLRNIKGLKYQMSVEEIKEILISSSESCLCYI